MTNELNKAIAGALSSVITAYPDEAPESATYPYAVISSKRLTMNDNISSWTVEINVWDKNEYYGRADEKADNIEKMLDFKKIKSGTNLLCLFKAQKDHIEDPDKAIKRVRTQFDMTLYESEA